MHAEALAHSPRYTSLVQSAAATDAAADNEEVAMVEAIDRNERKYQIAAVVLDTLVARCFVTIRALPTRCRCPLCDVHPEFRGDGAWDERMEHLAGHFERNKRASVKPLPADCWREDRELSEWLLQEGLVERAPAGKWRIGDGKPKRDV